jgi:hypothetical protein
MGLFDPIAPPNVETSRTTAATAPSYLTDYLTALASKGIEQLNVPGSELVAGPSFLQQTAFDIAPGALTAFQSPMASAQKAAEAGAAAITPTDISAFYNPYEKSVVDEMARQSAQNVQQQYLPQLRGAFGGTGAFGSRRYAGAVGQSLADVQSDLLGQQSKYRAAGFQSALDAALRQKTGQTSAANALSGIGTGIQSATTTGLKTLSDLGGIQQALEQAKIEAPTIRAQNIAQILRGYTYPTTTEETYKGPASIYGPSPLSQVAALSSLIGSGFSSPSGWGNKLLDWFGKQIGSTGLSYNPGAGYGTGTTSTGLNIYDPNNYPPIDPDVGP